jgi:PIN domain nuclease of toxin-antitoxin system
MRSARLALIVLDAQAFIAYAINEPGATVVRDQIKTKQQVLLSTANLTEVTYFLGRTRGATPASVYADIIELDIHVTRLDEGCAIEAASLRLRHYHRVRRPVSLADCCAAALALDRGAALVTSDGPLLDLMTDEQGDVLAVPASDGSLWSPDSLSDPHPQ